MPTRRPPPADTAPLPFGALRNSELFSNHWLQHRLQLEPEFAELRDAAGLAFRSVRQLWEMQRSRVEHYGDEAGLEQAFIQPLLATLGWILKYQTWLDGRKPDYALFLSEQALDAALRAGRNQPEFWQHPAALADAKAWHVSLDRPTGVGAEREYPPQQIEWYLNRSGVDYAILTNGRLWRLVPRQRAPGKARFQTYYECDLARLLTSVEDAPGRGQLALHQEQAAFDDFFRFFLFFGPAGLASLSGRQPLVARALAGSSEYALSIGEDLKERVFEALRLCIEGFLTHAPNRLNAPRDLELCREQSFVLLYRLLFIMYAEDRSLLPYRRNDLYTRNRSLARHRDEIADVLDRVAHGRDPEYALGQTAIWQDLLSLFDLIDHGHARYAVPAYNGGLFDAQRHEFLSRAALPDRYLARVIDQLGRAADPEHPERGLFRVDYRDLAIQHLGSIYEGLLELRPHFATAPMVVIRERRGARRSERIVPRSEPTPPGWEETGLRYERGRVYLQTDKGERRASGSYYTPDPIVGYIVENTLGPLCREIDQRLNAEIAQTETKLRRARGANRDALQKELDALRAGFDDRILRLRVLDPAMGSGHFLVRACQYLAEELATNPHASDPALDPAVGDAPTLVYWKRRVVESCIFGVDFNPMAVELATLALWLESVSTSEPLTFLEHHLRPGNSLVGARITDLGSLPDFPGGTANIFKQQVEQRLPILLRPLHEIRATPSQTPAQIKAKENMYRLAFTPLCDMFSAIGDLWCSTFFAPEEHRVSPANYDAALLALAGSGGFEALKIQPWFQAARAAAADAPLRAFHWELAFPEAFFDLTGRRAEGGFDAIIGNPPYDVLSERETGRDLSALKSFIEHDATYTPSRRGKNNLYKLFICRALELLADGGRFGFIVPMALLGDDQAADLRRAMLEAGALTAVEAFPQKDDPARRVFPDAKLSTCVFTLLKTADESVRRTPFRSRQHPADRIDESSPSLKLTTEQIPLYDPSNRAIVSCSQEDWDLAVRIMGSGRLSRLSRFCEFFQGEVNETIQRRAGNLRERGGKLVTRGAAVCLYSVREASQGENLYLDVPQFLQNADESSKSFHHRQPRVVLQESSPQNNFRRIIAAYLSAGEFTNHTVNYCPAHKSTIDLYFVLAILNCKLADWYFRLGSTNAHVSHYQLYNLPCPVCATGRTDADAKISESVMAAVNAEDIEDAAQLLAPELNNAPFPLGVQDVIAELVRRIMAIEAARGEIARVERSALDPAAQPLQDLIDRILYAMAGLNADEIAGLEARLATML
ncbi:Modification methylase TaqI [Phycisphaerae bacterium RAS1]|nr:Modification methylase TaqI [Phycisphaerae bacterium RAS1]